MKLLIDENVVIDALLGRRPFNGDAEKILAACADTHTGCLSVNSLTDIFYILRKTMSASSVKAVIKKLMELFEIITINNEDCQNALALPIDDFEDALVVIYANKAKVDFIVTRDKELINTDTLVKIISPDNLEL